MIKYSAVRSTDQPDWETFLTLDRVKEHLRIDHAEDDALIEVYRDAAMEACADHTQRQFRKTTHTVYASRFPKLCEPEYGVMVVPVYPIISVVVEYHNGTSWTAVDSSTYDMDIESMPCHIKFNDVPGDVDENRNMPLRFKVTGGYETSGDVPKGMISGALLFIGHLYENRQDVVIGTISSEIPQASSFLWNKYRILHY